MRKIGSIAAAALIAGAALTGCATKEDSGSTAKGTDKPCVAPKGDVKVGLAYDVGGRGDQSFNDSAYRGLQKAQKDLGVTGETGEAADGEAESAREERLRSMADNGMNPIIGVGFAYSASVNEVSPDYPEVCFAVIDGFDPDEDPSGNVAYLGFAEQEGSYLAGVAAALKSKTGTIGFVGGVHTDLIKKFEAGYVAGAKSVKPNVKVVVKYIQETDLKGFGDPAGGKAAAAAAIDEGADVVYHAAGGSGAGVFEAVTEAKVWAIGVDSDQFLTAPKAQQKHILTSMTKGVDVATFDMVKSVVDGEPLASYTTYDLKVGGVDVSTSGGFINDIKAQLDKARQDIVSGKVKVPTAP